MKYFCLGREQVECIKNFPTAESKRVYRSVDVRLKDGSLQRGVTVVGNEFYEMDTSKHSFFEPEDIDLIEENEEN